LKDDAIDLYSNTAADSSAQNKLETPAEEKKQDDDVSKEEEEESSKGEIAFVDLFALVVGIAIAV